MRLFIYYLHFPDEKIKEFIKNNSNNENWPRVNTYYNILSIWNETFKHQQDIVRQYVEHIKSRKKSDNSFLIKIKNAISGRIKIMKDPDFTHLDQYKLIEITPKMRADELANLREAHKIYRRLKEFGGSWANTQRSERIAMQETFNDFRNWNNAREWPIEEISKLLNEWQLNINKVDQEFAHIKELKTFEVEIKERTRDTLTFIWNVAEIDVPIWKKTVDGWKIDGYLKRMVMPAITSFLFMYNGQYYEVLDWKQTNYNTAEVTAQLSIFYNFYQYVIKASANGILHHSPLVNSKRTNDPLQESEICSCAEYDRADFFEDYISDYKLKLSLYKTEIKGAGQKVIYGGADDKDDSSTTTTTTTPASSSEKKWIKFVQTGQNISSLEAGSQVSVDKNINSSMDTGFRRWIIKTTIRNPLLTSIGIDMPKEYNIIVRNSPYPGNHHEEKHLYIDPDFISVLNLLKQETGVKDVYYHELKESDKKKISELAPGGASDNSSTTSSKSGKMVLPMIHGIALQRVGRTIDEIGAEVKKVVWNKFWNDTWNAISGISIAGFSLGQGQQELGVMYYLLNDKLDIELQRWMENKKYGWFKPLEEEGLVKNKLDLNDSINKTLCKWGLTNEEGQTNKLMAHFLLWHVKATLFWRKKQIWEGRYWMLHERGLRVNEICNASGNTITIFAYDLVLTRFTESITAKLGLSANGAMLLNCAADASLNDERGQNLRQVERKTVSDTKSDSGTKHSETTTKTTSPISGRNNKPRSQIPSPQPLLFGSDHTKSEYTFLQFANRWRISGEYPLGLRIQFNKNLLNQYRNRKELKGSPSYDYFNANYLGNLLNSPGFFQASIISWNVVPYADWFREKIEGGVNIYGDKEDGSPNPEEFYEKKISSQLNFENKGATVLGGFNTASLNKNLKSLPGDDYATAADGMSWIYKTSYCKREDGAGDIFPQLVEDGRIHIKIDVQDHSDSSCPRKSGGYCTSAHRASWRFDANARWQSDWIALEKDKRYNYSLQTFSKTSDWDFAPLDLNCKVSLEQTGSHWELRTEGKFLTLKKDGDPGGVPPAGKVSPDPLDPASGQPEPFNPATPMPAQTLAEPDPIGGGLGGEPELEPLEFEEETEPEPVIEQEQVKEKEQEQVKEKEPEPELPDDEQEFN